MTNQTPESVIAEVIEYHADSIDTHGPGCYKNHAACLAVKLRDMLREPGERYAALAAIERVRAIHQKKEADAVTGDCATESCEHEDKCPTQAFEVCIACWNLCEEADPYFGERGIGMVLWPCPTVAALDGAPEPEVKP